MLFCVVLCVSALTDLLHKALPPAHTDLTALLMRHSALHAVREFQSLLAKLFDALQLLIEATDTKYDPVSFAAFFFLFSSSSPPILLLLLFAAACFYLKDLGSYLLFSIPVFVTA